MHEAYRQRWTAARVEAKKDTQSLDNKGLLDYAKELVFCPDDNRKTLKDIKSEYIKMKPFTAVLCHPKCFFFFF